MTERVEKIRCDETGCTTIVAERRADGTIVIRAKHHGETHVTIIEPWPQMRQQDLVVVGIVKSASGPDTASSP